MYVSVSAVGWGIGFGWGLAAPAHPDIVSPRYLFSSDPRADQTEVAAYKYGHFPQIHFTDSSMKGLQQTDCGSQKI